MVAVTALQKRLDRLEGRPTTEPDIVSLVLTSLSDSDIDLLQELACLRESGFDEEHAASMMADRHEKALKAVATFQDRYAAILEQMKPKPRPKRPSRVRGISDGC